ncbi:MAG: hypothetical protein ACTTKP_04445 [Catonella sp.]|uniref:hypothetical protein n=1 Tax=Catonella sp. TaxID=2382125 RepID=UPI003F9EDC10
MWFLEWLLGIITFPITWFWNSYKRLKETRDVKRLIIFFVLSLSGFAILAGALLWLILWLITFHIEVIVIISVVCWLFAYVKAKMDKPTEEEPTISQELLELEEQAIKAYPTMRNIIYQTLKSCAENIGGIVPRVLADIEVLESHYVISQNICFYQFRLEKTDIRTRYQKEEITEFISILQAEINRKIQNKDFPTLAMEKFIDSYGNIYDAVYIDVIEDMDRNFLIQSVFYSPQYAEYLRQKKMVQQESKTVSNIPDAKWKYK